MGSAIIESPYPQVAACMAAGGIKAFATALIYGGMGLLALWALSETRGLSWEWHGWRERGRPLLSLRLFRDLLNITVFVAIIACFTQIGDAAFGSAHAASKVAAGSCPLPADKAKA